MNKYYYILLLKYMSKYIENYQNRKEKKSSV